MQCELLAESGVRWPGVQAAGAVCTTKRRAGVLPRFFFCPCFMAGAHALLRQCMLPKRQCEGSPPETGLCGWALSALAVVRRAHLCRTRMLSCALCSSSYPTPLVCSTLSRL